MRKADLCVAVLNTKVSPAVYSDIEEVILEVFGELDNGGKYPNTLSFT